MNEAAKNMIRIQHWIEHNKEHLQGYKQVADSLEANGHKVEADKLRVGIRHTEQANNAFAEALSLLLHNESSEDGLHGDHQHEHDRGHSHHHDHGHTHSHTHCHCHEQKSDKDHEH